MFGFINHLELKHCNIDDIEKILEAQTAAQQKKNSERQENYKKAGLVMGRLIEEKQAKETKTAILKELKTKKQQTQSPVRKM